ncbi:MAG TPA: hypothetical protein VF316_25145 [Polyangiaceae bacterium]
MDAAERTGKRWRRGVVIALGVISVLFVASTTWQLTVSVFDVGTAPVAHDLAGDDCAHRIRALEAALDRGVTAAGRAKDEAQAQRAFDAELLPEWGDEKSTQSSCDADPHGAEAYSALLRLKQALAGQARHQVVATAQLRAALHARLP